MGDHYYSNAPVSAHQEQEFSFTLEGDTLRFVTDAGVFSRARVDYGSEVLLGALPSFSGRILDLGCAWGAIGLMVAKKNPNAQVVLTDINERAAALCEKNRTNNAIDNAHVCHGDGFEAVEGMFDAVLINPPVRAGKGVYYPLFESACKRLNASGALYVVLQKKQGAPSVKAYLQELFGVRMVETLERSAGYHVLCARKE